MRSPGPSLARPWLHRSPWPPAGNVQCVTCHHLHTLDTTLARFCTQSSVVCTADHNTRFLLSGYLQNWAIPSPGMSPLLHIGHMLQCHATNQNNATTITDITAVSSDQSPLHAGDGCCSAAECRLAPGTAADGATNHRLTAAAGCCAPPSSVISSIDQ